MIDRVDVRATSHRDAHHVSMRCRGAYENPRGVPEDVMNAMSRAALTHCEVGILYSRQAKKLAKGDAYRPLLRFGFAFARVAAQEVHQKALRPHHPGSVRRGNQNAHEQRLGGRNWGTPQEEDAGNWIGSRGVRQVPSEAHWKYNSVDACSCPVLDQEGSQSHRQAELR